MSSALSQIAAVVAGLALLTVGLVFFFPEANAKGFMKNLAASVSLAIIAAVLISVARNFGA